MDNERQLYCNAHLHDIRVPAKYVDGALLRCPKCKEHKTEYETTNGKPTTLQGKAIKLGHFMSHVQACTVVKEEPAEIPMDVDEEDNKTKPIDKRTATGKWICNWHYMGCDARFETEEDQREHSYSICDKRPLL